VCIYICVCMYIYLYVYVYIYIYMCVYTCVYIYMCVCIYMCVYICVCMYIYMYIYVCVCVHKTHKTHTHVIRRSTCAAVVACTRAGSCSDSVDMYGIVWVPYICLCISICDNDQLIQKNLKSLLHIAHETAVCHYPHNSSNRHSHICQTVRLQTQLLSKISSTKNCSCTYFRKNTTCLRVGALRIGHVFFSGSCNLYRWVTTKCCVMSDIPILICVQQFYSIAASAICTVHVVSCLQA